MTAETSSSLPSGFWEREIPTSGGRVSAHRSGVIGTADFRTRGEAYGTCAFHSASRRKSGQARHRQPLAGLLVSGTDRLAEQTPVAGRAGALCRIWWSKATPPAVGYMHER